VLAVAHVAHPQLHQVAGAQLAVDAEIEEREFARSLLQLQAHPDGPDLLELERGLLAHQLALVPGFPSIRGSSRVHDELLSLDAAAHRTPPPLRPGG